MGNLSELALPTHSPFCPCPLSELLRVVDLGPMPYREAWALQSELQAGRVAAKRAGEHLPHVLLLVEHPPVFTIGKSGDTANILATDDELAARGAEAVRVDRGGDVTFHGPGQLVAYPILDLDRIETPEGQPLRDLHRYLRELEEVVIRTCADWNVTAGRVAGRTGVWVGPDAQGPERKVCAFGVRCSRWVTMHGLALNLTTDLNWFDLIVPCGIADRGVTSLHLESPQLVERATIVEHLLHHMGERFGVSVEWANAPDLVRLNNSARGKLSPRLRVRLLSPFQLPSDHASVQR